MLPSLRHLWTRLSFAQRVFDGFEGFTLSRRRLDLMFVKRCMSDIARTGGTISEKDHNRQTASSKMPEEALRSGVDRSVGWWWRWV